MNLQELKLELRKFADERDWDQFHSPKNLSMALSVEVAELVEHFQWLTQEDSFAHSAEVLNSISEELADIQIYLVRLADKLSIDLEKAVESKLTLNHAKYPADRVRGNAAKYTAYEQEKGADGSRFDEQS